MQFTERQNNTSEQVGGYLSEALALVESADVPEDLREAAFTAVINLVASKQIFAEQMQPAMAIPRNMRH
jgi:hypothetical protein